jgi:HSP20 family protein
MFSQGAGTKPKRKECDMYWENPKEWSPFDELRSLQKGMNRLFDGYDRGTAMSRFPALNVWGNEDQVVVTAELPGLEPEELDISAGNNQLAIKGERKADKPANHAV